MTTEKPEVGNNQADVEVKFNNQTYTLADLGKLQNDATAMEKSLQADYTTKTQQAAEDRRLADEKAKALSEDVAFYNAHPDVLLNPNSRSIYDPKVDGGKGLVGNLPEPSNYDEPTKPVNTGFESNPEMLRMKAELEELKRSQKNIANESYEAGTHRVKETLDSLKAKYQYADDKQVGIALTNFLNDAGRHAYNNEIAAIMKENHDATARIIARVTGGTEVKGDKPVNTTTATPGFTGTAPETPTKKPFSLDSNFGEFMNHVHDQNAELK